MSVVREKLDDPRFAGFFLQYKNGTNGATKNSSDYAQNPCAGPPSENTTKCSKFWPQLLGEPVCPAGKCDCGDAPCAMYSFTHRNQSFAKWFVSEYVMGKLGMGDKNQDGMYGPLLSSAATTPLRSPLPPICLRRSLLFLKNGAS